MGHFDLLSKGKNPGGRKIPSKKIKNFEADKDAENLLLGFADYGFPQYVYPAWEKMHAKKTFLSQETLERISTFISKCPENISNNLFKSLRIASIASNESEKDITKELLELSYPYNFSDYMTESCNEFKMDPKIMYGIFRSESFFSPEIKSNAGAIGIAQLMESTAADIAKRLKVENYDLTNPQTSIRFGTYYFNNLYTRLDSSLILAAFAYNSGITRVRKWVTTSKKELYTLPLHQFAFF